MLKFKIKGSYGETNFGDDLLMMVFENFLVRNFPNDSFDFEGEQKDYTSKLLTNSTYNTLKSSPDYYIYGGGTQFFSFTSKKISLLDKLKVVIINPRLLLNKIKKNKGQENTKKIFLGFGLGPFYDNIQVIEYTRRALSQAHFIGLRDEVSKKYCDDWNISNYLGADVAFSSYMDIPSFTKKESFKGAGKKIGIIVRDWDWEDSGAGYIENLLNIDNTDERYHYQFIIFAPAKDKKWIKRLASKDVLIWDPEKMNINSFLEHLYTFDAFISARYHGAIIGALLGKPVICVEIEPKLQILTAQVPEMILWKKPFSLEELKNHIHNLDFDSVSYADSIRELRRRADSMLNKVVEDIKHN